MKISSLHQGLKSFFLLSTFALTTTTQAMELHIRNPFDGYTEDNNGNRAHHFIPREPSHREDRGNLTLDKLDDLILRGTNDLLSDDYLLTHLTPSALGSQANLAYLIGRFLTHPLHHLDATTGRFTSDEAQNFFGELLNASVYFLRGHTSHIPQGEEPRSLNIPSRDPHIVTKPTIDMLLYLTAMVRHYGSQASPESLAYAFSRNTMSFLFRGMDPNGGSINPDLMGHLVSTAIFSKFFDRHGGTNLFRQVNNHRLRNAGASGRRQDTIGLFSEAKALLGVNAQQWNAIDTTGDLDTFQKQFKKTVIDRVNILGLYRQRVDEFKNRFVGGGDKGLVALSNQFNDPNFDPAQALSNANVILAEARRVLHIPQNEEVLTGNALEGLNRMDPQQHSYEEWRDAYFDPNNTGRSYVHQAGSRQQKYFIQNNRDTHDSFNAIWEAVSPLYNHGNNPTLQQIATAIRVALPSEEKQDLRDSQNDFFFVLPANTPQAVTLGVVEVNAIGTRHYIGENKIGKALHLLRRQLLDEQNQVGAQVTPAQVEVNQVNADLPNVNQVNTTQVNINQLNADQLNVNQQQEDRGNLQEGGPQLSQAAQDLRNFFENRPYKRARMAMESQRHTLTQFSKQEYDPIREIIQQSGVVDIGPNDFPSIAGFLDPRPAHTPLPLLVFTEQERQKIYSIDNAGEYLGELRVNENYGGDSHSHPFVADVLFTRLMVAIQDNQVNPNNLEALKDYVKEQINNNHTAYRDFKEEIIKAQKQGDYFVFLHTTGNPSTPDMVNHVPNSRMILRHGAAIYKPNRTTTILFGDNKFGRLIQQVAKDFVEERDRQQDSSPQRLQNRQPLLNLIPSNNFVNVMSNLLENPEVIQELNNGNPGQHVANQHTNMINNQQNLKVFGSVQEFRDEFMNLPVTEISRQGEETNRTGNLRVGIFPHFFQVGEDSPIFELRLQTPQARGKGYSVGTHLARLLRASIQTWELETGQNRHEDIKNWVKNQIKNELILAPLKPSLINAYRQGKVFIYNDRADLDWYVGKMAFTSTELGLHNGEIQRLRLGTNNTPLQDSLSYYYGRNKFGRLLWQIAQEFANGD